jgi:hypothetical protein
MSEPAKHTPGPWKIEHPDERTQRIWINAETNAGIAMIEPCDYGDGLGERLIDEDYANACIIAAAPDMLAALRYARNLTGPDEIIDAAIAKAEGRSAEGVPHAPA